MTPTRTLFMSLYTDMGGGEFGLYHLLEHLDRSQVEPLLLVNQRGPLSKRVEALGIEVVVIPFEVVTLKRLLSPGLIGRNLRASGEIRRFISGRGIRALVVSDVLSLLLLLPSLLTRRLRLFYSVIFFYEPLRALLFNLLALPFVDHIAVLSRYMQKDLSSRTVGLAGRMSTIYWGVDRTRFRPRTREERASLRTSLGLPLDKVIIGFVGRYEVWKGHIVFLDAAEMLLCSRPDAIVLIVGGAMTGSVIPEVAAYHARVRARIAAFSPSDRLLVWDHRDDVSEIMSSLDLVVCPSDREPYGLVVLESLACGVPVVASSTVGALEVVREVRGVFVAEPGSIPSLREAMESAISDSIGGAGASISAEMIVKWPNWIDYSALVEAKIRK